MTDDFTDRALTLLGAGLVIVVPRAGYVGRRHHSDGSETGEYSNPSNGSLTKVTRCKFHE
jgi:hypothetical protein